jgi:hypothetical protein
MIKDVLASERQAETIDQPGRRFFGTAAMTMAAVQLMMIASAAARVVSYRPKLFNGELTSEEMHLSNGR